MSLFKTYYKMKENRKEECKENTAFDNDRKLTGRKRMNINYRTEPPDGNYYLKDEEPGSIKCICPECGSVFFEQEAPGSLPMTADLKIRRQVFNTLVANMKRSHMCPVKEGGEI